MKKFKKNIMAAVVLAILLLNGCGRLQNENATEKKIVYTEISTPEYIRDYADMKELSEGSELVIYGEVINCCSFAQNDTIFSFEDIRVHQVLQGEASVGDTVRMIKLVGTVTLEEYIDSLSEEMWEFLEDHLSKYTEEERKELYVQSKSYDDIESEIGQKSIYFLTKTANFEEEHTYCRLNEGLGQYLETSENEFRNVRTIAGEREEIKADATEGIAMNEKTEARQIYTIESIQKEMQEGVDMEGVIPR